MMTYEDRVNNEYEKAVKKHGPMNSYHEAYAVLLEEVDELWEEVKKQDPYSPNMMNELIQVAAVCKRFYADLIELKEIEI